MKRHFLPILLIAAISIALYANTLNNGFVYDDENTIVSNTFINNINNLPKLFQKKDYFLFSGEGSYRPVVTLTYFMDYTFYGLKAWGFHLTNLLINTANGILLYVFLTLFLKPLNESQRPATPLLLDNQPFLISILFVTHPILTEAVNGISYREDLLTFFFYMATLISYIRVRSHSGSGLHPLVTITYLISYLLYFLALLSKEMALTLPIIIYCYEWTYKSKKTGLRSILFNPLLIGYSAVTVAYIYLFSYHFHNPFQKEDPFAWSILERVATMPWLFLSYLKLVLFPVSLSADYEIIPEKSISSLSFILPSLVIITLPVIAIVVKNWKKEVTFGILFFSATLIPVCNVIPLVNPLAERYLYLPTVGIVVITGSMIMSLLKQGQAKRSHLLFITISFFGILSLFSLTVVSRDRIWKDNYSLFSDTIHKMPNSIRAHFNLGIIYAKQGKVEKAIEEFETVIKLNPYEVDAHYNLGQLYLLKGFKNKAMAEFETILRLKPDFSKARRSLALIKD